MLADNSKNFRTGLFFVTVLILLFFNGWVLHFNFDRVSEQQRWVQHTHEVMAELEQVMSAVKDAETGVRGYRLTNNPVYLEPYHSALLAHQQHLDRIKSLTVDNKSQQNSLATLEAQIKERMEILKDLVAETDKIAASVKASDIRPIAEGKIVMDRIRDQVNLMKGVEEKFLSSRAQEADIARTRFVWALIITTILTTLAFVYAFNLFLRNMRMAADEARSQSIETWLRQHLAEISRLTVGDMGVRQTASALLSYLAKTMDSPGGHFYVVDNRQIVDITSFGTGEVPLTSKQIEAGLPGQAMLRDELWILDSIPENYWNIQSGMGKSLPTNLILIPLSFQGRKVGVIELASFRSFKDEEIDLLNKAGEIIGTSINAAQAREHMQALLEKTQFQAEELQAQQEELKTSNEELEQQTRALESQQQSLNAKNRELEQTRRDVESKAADLQRSNQYKSEFLAKMSHELRTPLNGLLILSTLLIENKDKNLSDQQIQFARSINNAGNDLLMLINDILDLSKIEARKLTLRAENFKLGNLMTQLEQTFLPQAKVKNLQIVVQQPPEADSIMLHTDRQRLEQVLRNFVSNSLKFTEAGSITLKATMRDDNRRVQISVIDTGIGIPSAKKQQIFEAFEQADSSISRKYGGTGLGLTISRELAHLLGGSIQVDSTEGAGSSFSITIPTDLRIFGAVPDAAPIVDVTVTSESSAPANLAANVQHSKGAAEKALANLSGNAKTILIVEDDDKFRASVVEAAKGYGFQPIEAVDGEVALAILQNHTPSAILLDIKLPGISGLGILEMIKQMPHLRHIPTHMISALDYQHNALRLGALGYLTKPVTLEKVRSALGRIENLISQKVRRVLVIEDDQRQSDAIRDLISGSDVEVTAAKTGKGAVQKLKDSPFDCIILDLTLPDVSGFDLLAELDSLDISLPPIVIYTGKDLSHDEETYLRKYSESIIIKGVRSPERLLDEVNLFLHRVESLLPADKQEMLHHLRSQEHSFHGKTVLLVDDDMRNVFALTSALEGKGFQVKIARNGQEALDALNNHPEIDITLMDIMMPVMDGFEAMRRIRASKDERLRKLPIIALTAKAMREDHEKCMEAGASDYLPKPINLDNLMTVLKVWMPGEKVFL